MTPLNALTWEKIVQRPYASCDECEWCEDDPMQDASKAARRHTQSTQHDTSVETVRLSRYIDPARAA